MGQLSVEWDNPFTPPAFDHDEWFSKYSRFPTMEPAKVTDTTQIYSFPEKHDDKVTYDVLVFQDTVILKTIRYMEGVSKTGKTWRKWKTESTTIFSLKRERYGVAQLRIYTVKPRTKKHKGSFQDTTAVYAGYMLSFYNDEQRASILFNGIMHNKKFGSNAREHAESFAAWKIVQRFTQLHPEIDLTSFQPKNLMLCLAYPALRLFTKEHDLDHASTAVRWNTKIWLKEPELKSFIHQSFGKQAVRKDFIKALSSCHNAVLLNLCHDVKGLIPVDWLVAILKQPSKYRLTHEFLQGSMSGTINVRNLFKIASLPQRKRILLEEIPLKNSRMRSIVVEDSARSLRNIPLSFLNEHLNEIDFHSWQTVHDTLASLALKATMTPLDVPQNKIAKAMDGAVYVHKGEKYVVRSPKINQELIGWGGELNNCIASYAQEVVVQKTNVFAVYTEDRKLYANLEVRGGNLVQFVTKYNTPVAPEMNKTMENIVKEATRPKKRKTVHVVQQPAEQAVLHLRNN